MNTLEQMPLPALRRIVVIITDICRLRTELDNLPEKSDAEYQAVAEEVAAKFPQPKRVHWTQTPRGRRRMRKIVKQRWADKVY